MNARASVSGSLPKSMVPCSRADIYPRDRLRSLKSRSVRGGSRERVAESHISSDFFFRGGRANSWGSQWDTFPAVCAVANFGMSAALRPVLGAFQPSSLTAPLQQGPFESCWLVGFRLYAVSLYRFILLLSPSRVPRLSPASLRKPSLLFPTPVFSRSSSPAPVALLSSCLSRGTGVPHITANNECIRNPTFLCSSVARFFVSWLVI